MDFQTPREGYTPPPGPPGAPVQQSRQLFRAFKRPKDASPKATSRFWGLGSKKDPDTSVSHTNNVFSPLRDPQKSGSLSSQERKSGEELTIPQSSPTISNIESSFHLGLDEPPLKRPQQTHQLDSPNEAPLRRPLPEEPDVAFPDAVLSIAVDVSGSTIGLVLDQEQRVISQLCSILHGAAKSKSRIIPWNHRVFTSIRWNQLHKLSASGGTQPSRLVSPTEVARTGLQNSSVWCLLTDGEIDEHEVTAFSNGITAHGLHGTASIIILFGYKGKTPMDCNISVGLSVFSTTPDCLFIFHDIDSNFAYILQCKGRFKTLDTRDHQQILDEETRWEHLSKFSYQSLAKLSLPRSKKLDQNEIRLQNNKIVSLNDIYANRVDQTTASEILEDNDNLNSFMLTAQLRGEDKKIGQWIAAQSLNQIDPLIRPRPADSKAEDIMRDLLGAIEDGNIHEEEIKQLQQALRLEHSWNWGKFVASLEKEAVKVIRRGEILRDSFNRMGRNRSLMSDFASPSSPMMLAPISPAHSNSRRGESPLRRREARYETNLLYVPGYEADSRNHNYFRGICHICEEGNSYLVLLLKSKPKDFNTPLFPQPKSRSGLVFPLAFGTYPETDILSTTICCDPCAYTLLKANLSPEKDDQLLSAIPMIPEAFNTRGIYWKTTLDAIDTAFQQRFHISVVPSIFLSVLYKALDEVQAQEIEAEIEAEQAADRPPQSDIEEKLAIIKSKSLRWACKALAAQLSTPVGLRFNESISSPRITQSSLTLLDLPYVLTDLEFSNPLNIDACLLLYPIGGFVVLMLSKNDLGELTGDSVWRPEHDVSVVWQRFLYSIVEKFKVLFDKEKETSMQLLETLLAKSTQAITSGDEKTMTDLHLRDKPARVAIQSLLGTSLFSEEDHETFSRLGNMYTDNLVNSLALGVFLQHLLNYHSSSTETESFEESKSGTSGNSSPRKWTSRWKGKRIEVLTALSAWDVFEDLRSTVGLKKVFEDPSGLNNENSVAAT